jgi:HSP90 family molecular chaperone
VNVLGEAISNSWNADAENVWIDINRENASFTFKDDGIGMTADDFQNKYLEIGFSKRNEGMRVTGKQRPFIGANAVG